MLIVTRMAQGVGAALMLPPSFALLNHAFHGEGTAGSRDRPLDRRRRRSD
ncbi:MAG: hypothetical protein ACLPYS_12185 [Vulcanimicrobiaceae bacterium]